AVDAVGEGEDEAVGRDDHGAPGSGDAVDEAVEEPVEVAVVVCGPGLGGHASSSGRWGSGGDPAAAARPARWLAWNRDSMERTRSLSRAAGRRGPASRTPVPSERSPTGGRRSAGGSPAPGTRLTRPSAVTGGSGAAGGRSPPRPGTAASPSPLPLAFSPPSRPSSGPDGPLGLPDPTDPSPPAPGSAPSPARRPSGGGAPGRR